jgi:hypothetical protein
LCCALARLTIASFDRRQARREPSTSTFANAAQLGNGTSSEISCVPTLRSDSGYERLKRRLAATNHSDRARSLDGKTQFITQTLAEAAT